MVEDLHIRFFSFLDSSVGDRFNAELWQHDYFAIEGFRVGIFDIGVPEGKVSKMQEDT